MVVVRTGGRWDHFQGLGRSSFLFAAVEAEVVLLGPLEACLRWRQREPTGFAELLHLRRRVHHLKRALINLPGAPGLGWLDTECELVENLAFALHRGVLLADVADGRCLQSGGLFFKHCAVFAAFGFAFQLVAVAWE